MRKSLRHVLAALIVTMAFGAPTALAQTSLDMDWDQGAENCAAGQGRVQAQAIDETTVAIRQSPCVDFEAPLMYLLLGEERALLIDSGVSEDPAATAELIELVDGFLGTPDGPPLPLIVAHTHGHQDHRAGDAAFAARPDTTVVPHDAAGLRQFFGFSNWPDEQAQLDLGGRQIMVVPTPGHHPDHVVFFDVRTRLLFTGDFYLPGRLLVDDIGAYRDSAARMVEFVEAGGVQQALGAHIEMDASGQLYAHGATLHENERQVAMPFGTKEATDLRSALGDFNGFYNQHPGYAISNPVHNLVALAVAALLVLTFLAWGLRRLWKRRR